MTALVLAATTTTQSLCLAENATEPPKRGAFAAALFTERHNKATGPSKMSGSSYCDAAMRSLSPATDFVAVSVVVKSTSTLKRPRPAQTPSTAPVSISAMPSTAAEVAGADQWLETVGTRSDGNSADEYALTKASREINRRHQRRHGKAVIRVEVPIESAWRLDADMMRVLANKAAFASKRAGQTRSVKNGKLVVTQKTAGSHARRKAGHRRDRTIAASE